MLKQIADARGIAIMLVHHTRKAEASHVIDELSGTAGIAGTADTLWVMKREQGEKAGVLHVVGRDVEESAHAIVWDDVLYCWKVVGDAAVENISREQKAVIEVLKTHNDAAEGVQLKDIAATLGKPKPAVSNLLVKLHSAGLVLNCRGGRWQLPDF